MHIDKSEEIPKDNKAENPSLNMSLVITGSKPSTCRTSVPAAVVASSPAHAGPCPCNTGGTLVGAMVSTVSAYDSSTAHPVPATPCTESNENPAVATSITPGHLSNDITATPDCTCINCCCLDVFSEDAANDVSRVRCKCITAILAIIRTVTVRASAAVSTTNADSTTSPVPFTSPGITLGRHLMTPSSVFTRRKRTNVCVVKKVKQSDKTRRKIVGKLVAPPRLSR